MNDPRRQLGKYASRETRMQCVRVVETPTIADMLANEPEAMKEILRRPSDWTTCATGGGRALTGNPGIASYIDAKHGVVGMTKAAAWEHAADGIRVNAVGPAFIKTPLVEKSLDEPTLKFLEPQHAFNRLGQPAEGAELVAWLASDAASFATGAYYAIDGGYLAR